MMIKIIKAGIILFMIISLQACYYDNEEELYPQKSECDSENVTYSGAIATMMDENCNSCHGTNVPQGNIITDNYTDLKVIADNGRLWGAVNHESGYSPMPQNLPKLNECDLEIIKKWIDEGALDN